MMSVSNGSRFVVPRVRLSRSLRGPFARQDPIVSLDRLAQQNIVARPVDSVATRGAPLISAHDGAGGLQDVGQGGGDRVRHDGV